MHKMQRKNLTRVTRGSSLQQETCMWQPGGLALLNAASDAFVAAPTPAAAPSLRGSNAAIAQAPHDMKNEASRKAIWIFMPQALPLKPCAQPNGVHGIQSSG